MPGISVFRRTCRLVGHPARVIWSGMGRWLRNRFPQNETPKEPVGSVHRYPYTYAKYILETLYFGETINSQSTQLRRE
jgi:hypothetical protein